MAFAIGALPMEKTPMKVLVCGGRNFANKQRLFDVLDAFDHAHGIDTLIHGGARGADTLAGLWAKERGVTVWVHPADWAKHKTAAGPIRNRDMLERGQPDLVIAFAGSNGTADMIRAAMAAGVKVQQV